jgi:BirA family transcriptional regulator, biotin operon repressor / biotin---[acetyl-CoA-carboxylase] ligase
MIHPVTTPGTPDGSIRRLGGTVERHARVASTNDLARARLESPDSDGLVIVAEEQTAGRGRRGRSWISPPGGNLYVSVALHPRIGSADAWQLGIATALAAASACGAVAPVALKWPNDVVAGDGRKVGGLLVETIAEGDRLRGAVLGIGLNVNWRREEMPAEIRDTATSLADLTGGDVDRELLLGRLVDALAIEIEAVEAGESPLPRYRDRCATLGTAVRVATADGVVTGRAVDLDPTGALAVEVGDGDVRVLATGEVLGVRPETAS